MDSAPENYTQESYYLQRASASPALLALQAYLDSLKSKNGAGGKIFFIQNNDLEEELDN